MSENNHGGAGRGQGRKPKTDGEKLVKRQVFLRRDQLEKLKKLPENLSEFVRRLVDEFFGGD